MGYKFQFVTLAGFHALNLSMFELSREYARTGMAAYSQLQQREFDLAERFAYGAVKHQRFVGTGYFDAVATVISAGQTSTCALEGSTETEQFESKSAKTSASQNGHAANNGNGHGKTNGHSKPNGHAAKFQAKAEVIPQFDEEEVALMPSGD